MIYVGHKSNHVHVKASYLVAICTIYVFYYAKHHKTCGKMSATPSYTLALHLASWVTLAHPATTIQLG